TFFSNSRNCSAVVNRKGDSWTAARRSLSSGEREDRARSVASCSADSPSWGSIAFRSFSEISDLLFAIHTLLSLGKLQFEADILFSGIIQHHHRVISGALLFRPHPPD